MNLSHVAAGRARSVEPGVFSRESVGHATKSEAPPNPEPSPYGWKYTLKKRIWKHEGPRGIYASRLLEALIDEFADANGRAWPGIKSLLYWTKVKSERTLQKALDELVQGGWLRIVPQTWTSLTVVQTAAGKRPPRRADAGQATNLYIVLDGYGREAAFNTSQRPGLARTSNDASNVEITRESPPQKDIGGQPQKDIGGPPANLHPDPDHIEALSKEESAERAAPVDQSTHISSKHHSVNAEKLEAWDVIVEAHTEKTKAVYGLSPLSPDVKRDKQQEIAKSLDEAAVDVQAKLQARTGVEHKLPEVRRTLAARVMELYFKRNNDHLRKVRHALRDLPLEFYARLIDARQLVLLESHDATPPRRVQLEQPSERIESVDKPVEIPQKQPPEEPIARVESVDKPVEVVGLKVHERVTQKPPAPTNGAIEARRIVETLNAKQQQEELFKSPKAAPPESDQPTRLALREWMRAELEQARASVDKPAQDKPSAHEREQDKPRPAKVEQDKPASNPHVERPLGRPGAPRWGAIGPRPTTARRTVKLTPDEVEPEEEHGRVATSQK
jgi:hypothetical protein